MQTNPGLALLEPEVVRTDGRPEHFSYPHGESPWFVQVGEVTIFGGGRHDRQQCLAFAEGFSYGRQQYVRAGVA